VCFSVQDRPLFAYHEKFGIKFRIECDKFLTKIGAPSHTPDTSSPVPEKPSDEPSKASAEQTAAEKAATDEAKKEKEEEEEAKATRAEPRSRGSDDQGPTRKTCSVSFPALILIGVVALFGIFYQCTQPAFSVTTGLSPRQCVEFGPFRCGRPLSRKCIFEPSAWRGACPGVFGPQSFFM
jgi:hypothetical protein